MRGLYHCRETKKPATLKAKLASLISAVLLSSCAHAPLHPANTATAGQPAVRAVEGAPLSSRWERGTCSFENNSVSYSDSSHRRATLRLDVAVEGPRELICSSDFTVVLTQDAAAVALGGDAVMDGREMLGAISGQLVAANSYEVSFRRIISESGGVSSVRLLPGRTLSVAGADGSSWTMDLGDPFGGWSVY